MGIYRSNNPIDFTAVDGIVIDESAPASGIRGVGTGTVLLLGQFQRGNTELTSVSGSKAFREEFGEDTSYAGYRSLLNKAFAALKVIRVVASDAVKAEVTLDLSLKLSAKHLGAYGNNISVVVDSGILTVSDSSAGASSLYPAESYDVSDLSAVDFSASKLVDAEVVDAQGSVADGSYALSGGSDGTVADTDYEAALLKGGSEQAANVVIFDEYNTIRNGYLKQHAALTKDRIVICGFEEGADKQGAIVEVANLRDSDGRIILAFNNPKCVVDGEVVVGNGASFLASIISQTAPNIDPSWSANTQFLSGVVGLEHKDLTRQDYIDLMNAGICAFEYDPDIGYKIKSGIVTQIANTEKVTILRRRMADFLTNSIGKSLKVYQGAPNSAKNRLAVKAAITSFDDGLIRDEILPSDEEVQDGLARLVDIESENTNDSIAQGLFIIVYKRRIYSSMRFIVLKAEIGQSVVVTEA